MIFSEIVGLQKYFQPVYNIDNETGEYWKQFIPNDKFYDILDTTFTAVQSANGEDKLSIWMVGRYGTGKSHASGVIKHLLWDNLDNISDYLSRITKHSIREKIKNYRENKKILPIVLVGGGNVVDARTLSLEIERALKKALKENNIIIQTKGDFERMIDKIDDNFINWENIINENIDLKMRVNNKNDIVEKLENENIEILNILENIFSEKGTHFSHEKISEWLKEVTSEIKSKGIADGLMIFWDEFTTILEKDKISEILNEIQSIAELSNKDNVYLYLISHRDYDQFPAIQETMDKVKGRFHTKRYPMVSVTTYQILSAAIQHKNNELWVEYKKNSFDNPKIDKLINELTNSISYDANTKKSIKNLYPIHPYTAYLSTFLANNLGSTQRSIFNFLYDNKYGFTKFITNEANENLLLTADYLWDYYAEVLENDPENRFMQVLERYNTYKQKIGDKNENYLSIFKGVLLLNSLYRITDHSSPDTGKINPHIRNIKSLFIGSELEEKVNEALIYLDSNEIIQKNPSDLYEIASTSLPRHEVDIEKENLINQYKNITQIIDFEQNKQLLEKSFNNNSGVLRETRIQFFSADTNEYIVKNNLNKNFKPSYHLDFAVFLLLTKEEDYKVETIINSLKNENEFNHITFVIIKEPFGEKNYKDFIDYLARANVYRNHSYSEDSTKSENFAKKIVETWINRIKFVQVYLNNILNETRDINSLKDFINTKVATKVFNNGVDILNINRETFWKTQKPSAKTARELVIFAQNRTEVETKPTGQYSYIKDIFKDKYHEYIVTEKLDLKNDIEETHPVVIISKKVNDVIEKVKKKATFNLATELQFLTKPPYGIYTNIPNMALLGFVLRPYINQLYTANTGMIVDAVTMRDKVGEIFDYWQKNKGGDKLNFRFGTQEEKELIEILSEIFEIEQQSGIQQLRWKVKEKIKSISFPLWSVKHTISDDKYKLKPIITEITDLIFSLDDNDIDLKLTNKILLKVKEKKIDLIKIFNQENFKDGFISFIKNIDSVNVDNSEIEIIIQYIRENQPEEINWKEDGVRETIKDWKLKKLEEEKTKNEPEEKQDDNSSNVNEPTNNYETKPKTINRVKNKISFFKGNIETLKSKLTKIIEEHPELADIIDKYFEEI